MLKELLEKLKNWGLIREAKSPLEAILQLTEGLLESMQLIRELRKENENLRGQLAVSKKRRFGSSSEKRDETSKDETKEKQNSKGDRDQPVSEEGLPSQADGKPTNSGNKAEEKTKNRRSSLKKPSLRYPQAEVIHTYLNEAPICECCGLPMKPTSMEDVTEQVSYIPAQVIIEVIHRPKFVCHKHDKISAAALPERIYPGSSFADSMIKAVCISKFAFLIPMNRFVTMMAHSGFSDMPSNSLIELTHVAADFLVDVYEGIKQEVLASHILHADETPHRMLEANGGKKWFLWNFSTSTASYFEIHNSRSGAVCTRFLEQAACTIFMSDKFSGYLKSITEANHQRTVHGKPIIEHFYCNAHARRKFVEAQLDTAVKDDPDVQFFVDQYRIIYFFEDQFQQTGDPSFRVRMIPYFQGMLAKCNALETAYSNKSLMGKAMHYFVNSYQRLSLFATHLQAPIDNNPAERELRGPVVGRKTWYGTHSLRGAQTAAILFSIFNSCKLSRVNIPDYWDAVVAAKLSGAPVFTPHQYSLTLLRQTKSAVA